jgi:hypothetical protein
MRVVEGFGTREGSTGSRTAYEGRTQAIGLIIVLVLIF